MKFELTKVYNFEGAFRGMRNPMNSWDRSDSYFGFIDIYNGDVLTDICDSWINLDPTKDEDEYYNKLNEYEQWLEINGILDCSEHGEMYNVALLGSQDLKLAQKLILAGNEHAKFMRQIFVSVDITAPLYWWKEFDTYKVGTVANSTSTMHKLSSTPITLDCFEMGDYTSLKIYDKEPWSPDDYTDNIWEWIIDTCEILRKRYLETEDKRYWKELIRLLPESWLQTRTVTMSYANLRNIYFQRKNHKLSEWHDFCDWVKTLPYSKELITIK